MVTCCKHRDLHSDGKTNNMSMHIVLLFYARLLVECWWGWLSVSKGDKSRFISCFYLVITRNTICFVSSKWCVNMHQWSFHYHIMTGNDSKSAWMEKCSKIPTSNLHHGHWCDIIITVIMKVEMCFRGSCYWVAFTIQSNLEPWASWFVNFVDINEEIISADWIPRRHIWSFSFFLLLPGFLDADSVT